MQELEELLVALVESDDIHLADLLLRDPEALLVNVDDIHVALEWIRWRHGEDLRLMVVDESREEERILIDLLERRVPMLRLVSLAVLQVGDRPFDGIAQERQRDQLGIQQLRRHERKVPGVGANGGVPVRGKRQQPLDEEVGLMAVGAVELRVGVDGTREVVLDVSAKGGAARLHDVDEEEPSVVLVHRH